MKGRKGCPPAWALLAVAVSLPSIGTPAATARASGWIEQTQLLAEPVTQALERRLVRAWSPTGRETAEIAWHPAVPPGLAPDGTVRGIGRLDWREKGASRFDRNSVVRSYEGEWRGGRFNGFGLFWDGDGRSYEGDWIAGKMSGSGTLRTADGVTYQGGFRNDLRDGTGTEWRPDGTVSSGLWSGDRLTGEPDPRKMPMRLAQASTGAVSVTAYADRARNGRERRDHEGMGNDDVVLYEQQAAPGRLVLRPDNRQIMELWKGSAPVTRYGRPEVGVGPAFILLDVKNSGDGPVQVTDGYLDVTESVVDTLPYLALRSDFEPSCATADTQRLDPKFAITNTGWGRVEGARVTYGFTKSNGQVGDASQTFSATLPTFLNSADTSVLPALRELGVNVARLQSGSFPCPSRAAVPQCLRQLIERGTFGQLDTSAIRRASAARDESSSAIIVTTVAGTLDYGWTDGHGNSHRRQSPFSIEIPLGGFKVGAAAECGAGGPDDILPSIELQTDRRNYRVPLPYRAQLAPGRNTRLSLSLGARKASLHTFQAVLRLSDGSTVRSGPIELQYFRERNPNSQ